MGSESVKVDTNNRILGDKTYVDNLWEHESVVQTVAYETSSTSRSDIPNMSITKFYDRATDVIVLVSFYFFIETGETGDVIGNVDIDGTTQYPEVHAYTAQNWIAHSTHVPISLDAGSHTFKLQLRSGTAGEAVKSSLNTTLIVTELHK